MNTTEANQPQPNNVIHMGDFLLRRLKKLGEKKTNLEQIAASVSKSDNPRNDAFAGPLLAKADKFKEPMDALERHILFIMHGGNRPTERPNSGYSLQYRQQMPQAPSVNININTTPQE